MSGKMCPGRLRMAVDIVGGTLISYFSLSGAPLLDLNESAVGEYGSCDKFCSKKEKWLPVLYQVHRFNNIVSCHGGVWKINWYNEAAQQINNYAKIYSTDIVYNQYLTSNEILVHAVCACIKNPQNDQVSTMYMYQQEHMSHPKGGEGASDYLRVGCSTYVLGKVLKATLPYLERAAGVVHSRLLLYKPHCTS